LRKKLFIGSVAEVMEIIQFFWEFISFSQQRPRVADRDETSRLREIFIEMKHAAEIHLETREPHPNPLLSGEGTLPF
jgi:hypothetical protein